MNPLNLLWIVPLSAGLGAFMASRFGRSKRQEDECYYCPFPCEHNK